VAKLFFLVSGEHQTLPAAELRAILNAESYKHRTMEQLTQVLRLEVDASSVKAVEFRSALTRVCCQELFSCNAELTEILDNIRSAPIEELAENQTFVVRVRKIQGAVPELSSTKLERKLGEQILEKTRNSKVNLTNPQITFFGVITDSQFIFGVKLAEISPKPFSARRPRRRPVFHPTAMQAKLARVMVNLAQPKRGDLLLDPFCGAAGILVEAGLIGCRVLGFDAKRGMLRGGRINLKHFGVEPEGMTVADARYPPVVAVDCVATDPPYGRSASTLGAKTGQIVEDFLCAVSDRLRAGRKICLAAPETVNVGEIGEKAGFIHVESHLVYVHGSLTREIVVFEKM